MYHSIALTTLGRICQDERGFGDCLQRPGVFLGLWEIQIVNDQMSEGVKS